MVHNSNVSHCDTCSSRGSIGRKPRGLVASVYVVSPNKALLSMRARSLPMLYPRRQPRIILLRCIDLALQTHLWLWPRRHRRDDEAPGATGKTEPMSRRRHFAEPSRRARDHELIHIRETVLICRLADDRNSIARHAYHAVGRNEGEMTRRRRFGSHSPSTRPVKRRLSLSSEERIIGFHVAVRRRLQHKDLRGLRQFVAINSRFDPTSRRRLDVSGSRPRWNQQVKLPRHPKADDRFRLPELEVDAGANQALSQANTHRDNRSTRTTYTCTGCR